MREERNIGLGGAVDRHAHIGDEGRDGGDIDDSSAIGHEGQHRVGHAAEGSDVEVQHPALLRQLAFVEVA